MKIKNLLSLQRYQRGQQAGILEIGCENILVTVALFERKSHESKDFCPSGSLLYIQKCLFHSGSFIHVWRGPGCDGGVGSHGTGKIMTSEMRGEKISMIKLALEASMKTERTVEGWVLKTLNYKAICLGGLYMAGWIEGRCHEP